MTTRNYKEMVAESMEDSRFWNVHDLYKGMSIEELRDIQARMTLPFSVCVINLTGDLNVGMIARSACIFGASQVYIFGRRKYDKRSTVGAQNYLPIVRVDGFRDDDTLDPEAFRRMLRTFGLHPIFIEQNGWALEEIQRDWSQVLNLTPQGRQPCIILGNESEGVPPSFMDEGATVISITQRGVLRSLNVSAAASIVMHSLSTYLSTVDKS